jgi:hypothetical protein
MYLKNIRNIEVLLKGTRRCMFDLLVLTSLEQLLFIDNMFLPLTKQATLIWRSTVLSHVPQLVFPVRYIIMEQCFVYCL